MFITFYMTSPNKFLPSEEYSIFAKFTSLRKYSNSQFTFKSVSTFEDSTLLLAHNIPKCTLFSKSLPRASPCDKPATKQSPAPVQSTRLAGKAGKC